jgi:hypothetical protein
VRGEEEVVLILYRAEGKGRRHGEAVVGARRRWWIPSAAARVGEGEEEGVVRGRGAKEQPQGSRVSFYRARRGEGASAGSNGHQWPWRFQSIQEGERLD